MLGGLGYDRQMTRANKGPGGRKGHTPQDKRVKKQFGANLRMARQQAGISKEQLALLLSQTDSTWDKVENGVIAPGPETTQKLAYLGFNMNYLYTGIGDPLTDKGDALLSAWADHVQKRAS